MPIINIYRVITDTGYAEFRDEALAFVFAQGREIESLLREVPESNVTT
jgi:hypothetical protein